MRLEFVSKGIEVKKHLNVEFGSLSIGPETASIGIKIDRSEMSLDEADRYLCGRQLTGEVTTRTKQDDRQKKLGGMEDSDAPSHSGTFDVRGFRAKPAELGATLAFPVQGDLEELSQMVKRSGRLIITNVAAIKNGDGDDDDDSGPDPDAAPLIEETEEPEPPKRRGRPRKAK